MSWWTTFKEGASAVGNGLVNGASWAWENASLKQVTVGVATYAANTVVQTFKQGVALGGAIPTLIYNADARKIANGMLYMMVYDVLPLVALNGANNSIQTYCRQGHSEDTPWYTGYSLFLSGLTVANYAVRAYTWRQGAQSAARILVLDSLGPAAFNSNKEISPEALCTEMECTTKRKMKGWGREPLILLANDGLTWGISRIPYVGYPLSEVLGVYFAGRYMTRLATPERCERHKEMMQESVLSLGLTYRASVFAMDWLFEAANEHFNTGIPPWLFYRTLRHLLLLMHVNVASHMELPRGVPKNATVYLDPLNIYERISRFIADVIFDGLKVRVPIDFKLEDGAKPLIPLSTALKFGTNALNRDVPMLNRQKPGFFSKAADWVLPPMFRSADGFINDAIIAEQWPAIQEGIVSFVQILNRIGREDKMSANLIATATWMPGTTEVVLQYKYGIPEVVTKYGLRLSKKEDFWDFAAALKGWFERHSVRFEVILDDTPQVPLLGDKEIKEVPKDADITPVKPAVTLVSKRNSTETVSKPETLISRKTPTLERASSNPYSLLTNRKRDTRVHNVPEVNHGVNNSF